MRSTSAASVAFVLATLLSSSLGCSEAADSDSAVDEGELTAHLPAANAAPLLDAEEIAFVRALNAYRQTRTTSYLDAKRRKITDKLSQLRVAVGLVKAAKKHSQELASLNALPTHNDGGKGDKGALEVDARGAAYARIDAQYPMSVWGADMPGETWGEDCVRRADIASGHAAFDAVRLAASTFGESTTGPNVVSEVYYAIGVGRAKSANGMWYWTVTYGAFAMPEAPLLSLDDSAEESLLSNGSFETAKDSAGRPAIGAGVWSGPASWYGPNPNAGEADKTDYRVLQKWHVFAGASGSVEVRSDNAYFVGAGQVAPAHGLRMVDGAAANASVSATQLVRALPGINYGLSARARKIDGSGAQAAYLDFVNAKYERLGVTTVHAGPEHAWTSEPLSVSATAPAGTAYVRIILNGTPEAKKGSTYDWDDVRLRAW